MRLQIVVQCLACLIQSSPAARFGAVFDTSVHHTTSISSHLGWSLCSLRGTHRRERFDDAAHHGSVSGPSGDSEGGTARRCYRARNACRVLTGKISHRGHQPRSEITTVQLSLRFNQATAATQHDLVRTAAPRARSNHNQPSITVGHHSAAA